MQPTQEVTFPPSAVSKQPKAQASMNSMAPPTTASTQNDNEPLRLRGGCPGKFCGLPILPCRVNICIFPIPCC